ncbi:MAG: HDOD domain-containing protein [Actinomycetota bacterium]
MRNVLRRKERGPDFASLLGEYEPPSFPVFITQALDALADPDSDMASIATIVQQDPGASARTLRVVNSAGFGLRTSVTNVHQAATLLGRHQLEALLISIGARAALPSPPDGNGFNHERFWATSMKRATLASLIAARIDPTRQSENFTAALLQDMGIPVLVTRESRYTDVLAQWHSEDADLSTLERDVFGWHHGDVAAWLGERWDFPEHYLELLSGHHDGEPTSHLIAAKAVAPMRETDTDGDEAIVAAGEAAGISADEVRTMMTDAGDRTAAMMAALG